jgi:hypothetical protein
VRRIIEGLKKARQLLTYVWICAVSGEAAFFLSYVILIKKGKSQKSKVKSQKSKVKSQKAKACPGVAKNRI